MKLSQYGLLHLIHVVDSEDMIFAATIGSRGESNFEDVAVFGKRRYVRGVKCNVEFVEVSKNLSPPFEGLRPCELHFQVFRAFAMLSSQNHFHQG